MALRPNPTDQLCFDAVIRHARPLSLKRAPVPDVVGCARPLRIGMSLDEGALLRSVWRRIQDRRGMNNTAQGPERS
tara:strand:- start:13671 stop:13898 length:228 start_codon:yes stop_codon:yes gene_type:complete